VPFDYLRHDDPYSFNIKLEITLVVPEQPKVHHVLADPNFKSLYWTLKQQIAHHTITGCNLRPGDLLASGTINDDDGFSGGSLLELSKNGNEPVDLVDDYEYVYRTFLQDGDSVILNAYCRSQGYQIGFGDCVGTVLPQK
jgi:fumarylacetoacetase